MIRIPEQFANRRVQVSGDVGRKWIGALPAVVEELCRRWRLDIDGEPFTGEVGLALPVRRGEDQMILKVSFPDPDSEFAVWALRVWNGNGAVRLVDHDGPWNMLLERLDQQRSLRSLHVNEAIGIAARLLRRLAVECSDGPPTQSQLVAHIRNELITERRSPTRAVPAEVLELAIECAEPKVEDAVVLVNTDLHYENVLAGEREPWLAIDPKVVMGQVEYGIAPLLWNLRNEFARTSPARYLEAIVEAGGFDIELARRLTILRTADYWMWAVETGLTSDPRMCHEIIEALR